nr:pheophytinase, chloroplastic [Quercus suber]
MSVLNLCVCFIQLVCLLSSKSKVDSSFSGPTAHSGTVSGYGYSLIQWCALLSCSKFTVGIGYQSLLKQHSHQGRFRSSSTLGGFRNVDLKVSSGNYDGYVIDGKEDARDISKPGESETKVVIPGMPDESNGESSAAVSSCFWEWKPKFNVHYEKSGCEKATSPPVLFLPGFGVGSFHYEKQLKDLGRDFRVWAIDFLGQGMSLPSENPTPGSSEGNTLERKDSAWGFGDETEPWASELVYSIDLWQDQVRYFIEELGGCTAAGTQADAQLGG